MACAPRDPEKFAEFVKALFDAHEDMMLFEVTKIVIMPMTEIIVPIHSDEDAEKVQKLLRKIAELRRLQGDGRYN